MSSPPDINPYAVLGVCKDATIAEIKSAHRKRVLKCHPDKIHDESQRGKAQDEFQQVQQAYELLSDPARRTKYDQKARLAELKRAKMDRSSAPFCTPPRTGTTSASRECRNGRIYEERVPTDTLFEYDHFTSGPRPTSRKHDEFTRHRPKGADDYKRPKGTASNSFHGAAEADHGDNRASYSTRAKYRTRERRREAYEKYERRVPYPGSDSDSDSDSSTVPASTYEPPRRSEEPRRNTTYVRTTRAKEPSNRRDYRDYDDEYSDEGESKHDHLHTSARDYILRSRSSIHAEVDSRRRGPQSPAHHYGYESAGQDYSSRRFSRPARTNKDSTRPQNLYDDTFEYADPVRNYESKVPGVPDITGPPGVRTGPSVRSPIQPTRSATTAGAYSRPKRESSSRSESALYNMVYNDRSPPRLSRRRDRYDSGYSSPGTPEMHVGANSSKSASIRYKIVTEPETILVEPAKPPSRRQKALSPRRERSPISRAGLKPVRSSTYPNPPDSSTHYEDKRPNISRTISSRFVFSEVEYSPHLKGKDIKYSREIGPDDVIYASPRHRHEASRPPPTGRSQMAYT